MSWLVDAHVHYQECFGWQRFLEGAVGNLDRLSSRLRADAGCLLFVDSEGDASLEQLRRLWAGPRSSSGPGREDWTLEPTAESGSYLLRRANGLPLLLVSGRQIATSEGLEVLAIGTTDHLSDGQSIEDTVRASLEAGAITVIPWGFGKWWLSRGRLVEQLLQGEFGAQIHLGDNGNRAAWAAEPRLFEHARRRNIPILPGSDPLPLPHHAHRALSYGFRLGGTLDPGRPVSSLRARLRDRSGVWATFGRLQALPRFVNDQLRMQFRVRRRSHAVSGGDPRAEAS